MSVFVRLIQVTVGQVVSGNFMLEQLRPC